MRVVPEDAIDAAAEAARERQRLPGAALAVVRSGAVEYVRGCGLASVELKAPVTPRTPFCIGSLTKQFTAAAVLRLAEAGALSLDGPVLPHFPEIAERAPEAFRDSWRAITARHLLTHTSGLKRDPVMFRPTENTLPPDYIPVLYAWARQDFTPDTLLGMLAALPLDFAPPGAKQSYSNAGYTLLGMLVERIGGLSYGEYLRRDIFAPLGMESTRLVEEDVIPGMATGYTWAADGWRRGGYVSPTRDHAAGSLVSTVPDLARWDAALYGDAILSAASRAAMWTPAALNDGTPLPYGLGWGVGERAGHRWVGHSGMWGGFTSYLLRLPEDALTVVVLTNLGVSGRVPDGGQRGDPASLAWEVAGLYLPEVARPDPPIPS